MQITVQNESEGDVQVNGALPRVHYRDASNVAGSEPFLNLFRGGDDRLVVIGSDLPQRIDVNVTDGFVGLDENPVGVGVPGQNGRVAFSSVDVPGRIVGRPESLEVRGLDGIDIFRVTPGPIPVSLVGGNPVSGADGRSDHLVR